MRFKLFYRTCNYTFLWQNGCHVIRVVTQDNLRIVINATFCNPRVIYYNMINKIFKNLFIFTFAFLVAGCEKLDLDSPRPDTKIAFLSRRTENSAEWSLMAMNKDGSGQKIITDINPRCEKPVVSNSGKNILFVHLANDYFYELYSVNNDGSGLYLIDKAGRYCGSPAWSKDDSKIIYSRNRNETTDEKDLILFDVFSREKKVVATGGDNSCAVFSGNNKIAYCHRSESNCDIYIMDNNGENKHLVVARAWNPVWSPAGERMVYLSAIENGSSQIFIVNADGSGQKQLTSSWSSRIWPGWPPEGNMEPVWAPDGSKIIYVSWEDEDPEIHSMRPDGSGKVKLTRTDKRDENPVVTQDGKYILFSSKRNLDMGSEIFIMTINGESQKPLTNHSSPDIYPVEIRK